MDDKKILEHLEKIEKKFNELREANKAVRESHEALREILDPANGIEYLRRKYGTEFESLVKPLEIQPIKKPKPWWCWVRIGKDKT